MDYKLLLKIGIIFLTVDAFFLWYMKKHFQKVIRGVQGSQLKMRMEGVVLCYIFLIYGFYRFIAVPGKNNNEAFLFGLIIYGVFESTNYAIFKKWPLNTVMIDTLWGGCLFALTNHFQSML